jgi:hypothetical protein
LPCYIPFFVEDSTNVVSVNVFYNKEMIKLTIGSKNSIITRMKRLILLFCLVMVVGGCGKRSELVHDADFPRNYPVY